MKFKIAFILVLLSFGLFSQTDQLVTIKGIAPSYVGKTILFNEIEDYFSLTESTHASTTVKPDSTFSCSFLIKETQKIHVLPDINAGYMYIEPGGRYEIFIPEKAVNRKNDSGGKDFYGNFMWCRFNGVRYKFSHFEGIQR